MYEDPSNRLADFTNGAPPDDEGGLRAPPDLHGWEKAWWWFHFLILVNLARLRFVAILVVIGLVIMKWDVLAAYYDKWTRPDSTVEAAGADYEYFCPMHPTVVRDNNNEKCPICFMPLSKRKKGASTTEALPAGVVNRVQLSPYRLVLAGVQTWPTDYVPLTKELRAVGFIEFNERGQKTVAARSTGRIDKLYANETGQMVQEGDDLALLYSPDLMVTVKNLIEAKNRGDKQFVESARTRLKLLGIDDAQIDEFLAAGKPDIHVRIRSPLSGHVITKYVKEGQYVQDGMPLYELADLSTVWIQAQIYEDDLSLLPGDYRHGPKDSSAPGLEVTATTRSFPNQPFHGKLAFIYPHVDQESRTVTVRFELDNPDHKLRPGGTAEVSIEIAPKDIPAIAAAAESPHAKEMLAMGQVLAVPESAVIDTGRQKIVYREASPGVYEGVEVLLGPRMTDPKGTAFFPVLHGLEPGERIVTSGSFLVDAETRLNPAAGSIYFGNSGGTKGAAPSVTSVRPSTPEDVAAKTSSSLAKLSSEDRALVLEQKYCPILGTLLGMMGTPVKLMVEGQPVFLCCAGCKEKALDSPQQTLTKLAEVKAKAAAEAKGAAPAERPAPVAPPPPVEPFEGTTAAADAKIATALAKLSPEDRRLVQAQRVCPITGAKLGSMGPPIKLVLEGQSVFLCCEGCTDEAQKKPSATLRKVAELRGDK